VSGIRAVPVLFLASLLLLGPTAPPSRADPVYAAAPDAWPKFRFDSQNTGFNPFEHVLTPAKVRGLHALWSTQPDLSGLGEPSLLGGVLYVGAASGSVYALDASTGTTIWTAQGLTGYGYPGPPALANGAVFITSISGFIYAFRASDGKTLWKTAIGFCCQQSAPAVENGMVYVGSPNGLLYALNERDGTVAWTATTGGAIFCSPALDGGNVFIGSADDNLYAFNALSGESVWTAAGPGCTGGYNSSPVVSNGIVYQGSFTGGTLYAVDEASGTVLWSEVAGGGGSWESVAIAHNTAFAASSGSLQALDATTGDVLWTQPISDVTAAPVVANGVVYVMQDTALLAAWRASDGLPLKRIIFQFGEIPTPGPLVAGGVVYLSQSATIYAFGP
jgi:outer membrane protein assembly factor BamB